MRTVNRKIRPGERRRVMCDHCNTLWDKRLLRRDSDGLWTCPQEGPGKASVELTKGNAAHLKAFAERLRVPAELTGRYGDIAVTAIASETPGVLGEDGTPITGEDGVYLHQG